MSTLDIQKSLLTDIYNLLTADTTLKSNMGGTVRLYHTWAETDAVFPYLVYRIDMGNVADWCPQRKCTLYLDIWSDSTNADEALDIRKQIVTLIDNYHSSTDETSEFFIWLQTDGFVPEAEEGIYHYAMQFNLKFVRDSHIGALLYR